MKKNLNNQEDMKVKKQLFAVIEDIEYYRLNRNDRGWGIAIAGKPDGDDYDDCIGSRGECERWLSQLGGRRTYLNQNEASVIYRIVKVIDLDADYQAWLNVQNCPRGLCENAKRIWAEDKAFDANGILPILHHYDWLLIDLAA